MRTSIAAAFLALGCLLLAPVANAKFDVVYDLSASAAFNNTGPMAGPPLTGSMTVRYQGLTNNPVHGPVRLVGSAWMRAYTQIISWYGDYAVGSFFWTLYTTTGSLTSSGGLWLGGWQYWTQYWHCVGATCPLWTWRGWPMTHTVLTSTGGSASWWFFFGNAASPGSGTLYTTFYGSGSATMDGPGSAGGNTYVTLSNIHAQEVSRTNVTPLVPTISKPFLVLLVGLFIATVFFYYRYPIARSA